jgi:hypothetical protein
LSEGLIAKWMDQSGNVRDAFQPDPKLRPALLPSARAGMPVVRFNGLQSLRLPAGFSDLTDGLVVLAVARPIEPDPVLAKPISLFHFFDVASSTVEHTEVIFQVGALAQPGGTFTGPTLNFNIGSDGFGAADVAFDSWQLFEAAEWAGIPGQFTACSTLVNGNELAVEPCPVPPVIYRDDNSIGSVLLATDIAELLVYDSFDDAVVQAAESYLLEKWALK